MGEVRFIRKNGRIIPIRNKKDSAKIKKGSALVAGGGALAAGSGYVAGRIFRSAQKTSEFIESSVESAADLMVKTKKTRKTGSRIPKGQMSFAELNISQAAKKVPKYKAKIFASAKTLKYGGFSLGGLLIGEGLQRLYEGSSGKETGVSGEIISTSAGIGTVALAKKGFKKGAGKSLLRLLSRGKIK